jgi:hypothetical protein
LAHNGVNGFLVESIDVLRARLDRVAPLDPYACRRIVEGKFSAALMAARYWPSTKG